MHESDSVAQPRPTGPDPAALHQHHLGNELVFLARIRTTFALLAAGIAARQITLPIPVHHARTARFTPP